MLYWANSVVPLGIELILSNLTVILDRLTLLSFIYQ